jgi:hypothetical protein
MKGVGNLVYNAIQLYPDAHSNISIKITLAMQGKKIRIISTSPLNKIKAHATKFQVQPSSTPFHLRCNNIITKAFLT